MKRLELFAAGLLAMLFAFSAFAQIPATSFDAPIAASKQTLDGLRAQLDIAQKQLDIIQKQITVVQGANTQLHKDLSDAQAKVATCKAY